MTIRKVDIVLVWMTTSNCAAWCRLPASEVFTSHCVPDRGETGLQRGLVRPVRTGFSASCCPGNASSVAAARSFSKIPVLLRPPAERCRPHVGLESAPTDVPPQAFNPRNGLARTSARVLAACQEPNRRLTLRPKFSRRDVELDPSTRNGFHGRSGAPVATVFPRGL